MMGIDLQMEALLQTAVGIKPEHGETLMWSGLFINTAYCAIVEFRCRMTCRMHPRRGFETTIEQTQEMAPKALRALEQVIEIGVDRAEN